MPQTQHSTPTPSQALPSAHRLPPISASQAFASRQQKRSIISSGSSRLDEALRAGQSQGGISRAHLTEVSGPPGSGKTTLALQLALNTIKDGGKVVWIDSTSVPPLHRLLDSADPEGLLGNLKDSFTTITCPTLPHLIALLRDPDHAFIPSATQLLVVDNITTLFTTSFPPATDDTLLSMKPGKKGPNLRKFSVMAELAKDLSTLATGKDIAVVVLSQLVTRVIAGSSYLQPFVSSQNWDSSFTTQILLHRNDSPKLSDPSTRKYLRFASVTKANGLRLDEANCSPVPIMIKKDRVEDVELDVQVEALQHEDTNQPPEVLGKRKRSPIDLSEEIPDSDEESDGTLSALDEAELGL
ncbi:P-loop containing nucleoside triphosphate hydrolase protein [Ascobolus immersus RN42]|uniref:DNA repair protein RAD51 homolog 3 n=1 Tax=Ascobolus immersus RN42 TaxID=1160509 RepID=A0A3N4INN2_ASCIM|nr:P-loop containing nucleoside triphosphate hydrolase protein [Ascobolus immersus RN42]